MTDSATLHVRPELITGLDELAKASGRSRDELAEEALADYLAVQRWQIAGVEEAVLDADAGEPGIPHEDIAAWLDSWERTTSFRRRSRNPDARAFIGAGRRNATCSF